MLRAVLVLRRRGVRAGDYEPFRVPLGLTIPGLACAIVLWGLSNATRTEFMAVAGMLEVAAVLHAWRGRALTGKASQRPI